MKKITLSAIAALFLLSQMSCFVSFRGGNTLQSACERNKTGEICFVNDTKKDLKLSIGNTKTELNAHTSRCMDMYEGEYEYKAKQGFKKWEDFVSVERCDTKEVYFFR